MREDELFLAAPIGSTTAAEQLCVLLVSAVQLFYIEIHIDRHASCGVNAHLSRKTISGVKHVSRAGTNSHDLVGFALNKMSQTRYAAVQKRIPLAFVDQRRLVEVSKLFLDVLANTDQKDGRGGVK